MIRLRHGLSDGYTYRCEEVAEVVGVSPDRVTDTETQAIGRLRSAGSGD
jgi:DNA-directed RNA polymerase sigma subunit (sigma70/sigma32)